MMFKVLLVAFSAVCLAVLSSPVPSFGQADSDVCDTRRTLNGGCCVFPFTYRGKQYDDCTKQDGAKEWCATTDSYDNSNDKWGACDKAPKEIFDVILETNKNKNGSDSRAADNVELFQGDIVVDEGIRTYLNSRGLTLGETRRRKRAVMRNNRARWIVNGKGLVPYQIERSNARERAVILRAMRHWESKVPCLKFKRRNVGSRGKYLSFFSGGGCYSMVGRQGNSGAQKISIGRGCGQLGVVAHEIGHALGFWHEQSRPDRDSYVTINWGNIQPGVSYNFHKYGTGKINSRGVSYDYNSIMHYSSTAFAKRRGVYTIVGKDGRTNLGQRYGLSAKDVIQANKLYCGRGPRPTAPPTPPTPPPPPPPSGCRYTDNHRWCPYWKGRGYCTGPHMKYMKKECKKSCFCTASSRCTDKFRICSTWKGLGHCTNTKYAAYVKVYCKKSCGVCR